MHYGDIFALSSGLLIYVAERGERNKGLFRGGELTDSAAIAKGTAEWAMDEDLLAWLYNKKGIEWIAINWWPHEELYLAHIFSFTDRTKSRFDASHVRKGGAAQWYQNIRYFRMLNRAPAPARVRRKLAS